MGTCKYCGKSTGLFSNNHTECEGKHSQGLIEARALFVQCLKGGINPEEVKAKLQQLEKKNYLNTSDLTKQASEAIDSFTESLRRPYPASVLSSVRSLTSLPGLTYSVLNTFGSLDRLSQKLIKGFMVEYFTGQLDLSTAMARVQKVLSVLPLSSALEQDAYLYVLNKAASNFMKDGVLSDTEETLIGDYINALSLPMSNLPATYSNAEIQKIGQALVLKDLQKGIMPQTNVPLPIILGKNENVLWAYGGVSCYMEKVKRETVGRTGGFSFRIMKGVTYRVGQFKGHPVEHSYMDKVGTGSLFVTNKNLIFYSETTNAKVPYNKIIGITPYSDGIEVHKDGNAKRLTFQGFDSWFIMNVITLVNNL